MKLSSFVTYEKLTLQVCRRAFLPVLAVMGLSGSLAYAQSTDNPSKISIEDARSSPSTTRDNGETIVIEVPRSAVSGLNQLTTTKTREIGELIRPVEVDQATTALKNAGSALQTMERQTSISITESGIGRDAKPGQPVPSGRSILSNRPAVTSGAPQTTDVRALSARPPETLNPGGVDPIPGDFLPRPLTEETSQTAQRGGAMLPMRPEQLPADPIELKVPDVFKTTLPNGIRFYHYPSKDLPRVQVNFMMRGGSFLDPADKVGLADLAARTVRAGGAAGKAGDDVDRQLEQIGSTMSWSANREFAGGRLFALSENVEPAMKIAADILLRPELDAKKLEEQRGLMLEDLRRENDQASEVSRREYRKIIYGNDHPLARTPKPEQLKSITQADVRKFYEEYYRPSSLWIGVSGDISREDAMKLVEKTFGEWKKPEAQLPPPPTVDEARDTSGGVYYIRKMTAQSQIRIGHLGVDRLNPDRHAITVMNAVYGTGGFSSRLMNRVRTKRGFVYGVGGGVLSDTPRGLFVASAGSKARTTAAAIQEILDVTSETVTQPITEEELEIAKRDTIFSFMTEFDQSAEVIEKHMTTDFQGYPEDYLQTYVDKIRSVTKEQAAEVAQKYIRPDNLKIFVIGFDKQFDKPLTTFGPVTELPLDAEGGQPGAPIP